MTLEFKINEMERQVVDGFVTTIYWNVSLTDGAYSASRDSQSIFTQKDDINFIPFEELTQDLVIGWIKSSLSAYNLSTLEECLLEDIARQKIPPTITGTPWDNA